MTRVAIRPMRWWHIEQAMHLERELFGDTAWNAAQMWSELARDQRRYYALIDQDADSDGGVVRGYAGVSILSPESDVQTVAVSSALRGHGWGRRLLSRLIQDAREAGCTQMMLEVSGDNLAAQRLYAGLGFEVVAQRSSYYGPGKDALIMRLRPLSEPSTHDDRSTR